jgi:hypothetical protein
MEYRELQRMYLTTVQVHVPTTSEPLLLLRIAFGRRSA